MVRPSAAQPTSISSRRSLVSSRLALITQKVLVRRYHPAWAWNHRHAPASARKRRVYAGESTTSRFSKEYTRGGFRGVKRTLNASSSMRRRTSSIHPKYNASSCASG